MKAVKDDKKIDSKKKMYITFDGSANALKKIRDKIEKVFTKVVDLCRKRDVLSLVQVNKDSLKKYSDLLSDI